MLRDDRASSTAYFLFFFPASAGTRISKLKICRINMTSRKHRPKIGEGVGKKTLPAQSECNFQDQLSHITGLQKLALESQTCSWFSLKRKRFQMTTGKKSCFFLMLVSRNHPLQNPRRENKSDNLAKLREKSGGHQGLAQALQKYMMQVRFLYWEHLLSEPLLRKEDPTLGKKPFQKSNHLDQPLDPGGFSCSPFLFYRMQIHIIPMYSIEVAMGTNFHLAADPGAEICLVSLVCIVRSAPCL